MKRYKTGILSAILPTVMLVLTLVLSSCVKQELPGGGEFGEGEATVTLELVPPGAYSTPQTRATDQEQNDIREAMVFVFKNDKVVQWIPVPTITDKKMTVNGIRVSQNESDKFDIVAVANHPLDVAQGHDFMNKTREYLSDFFQVSSTPASINDLRMWGEARGVYVHPVSNSLQIKMLRSLARIDVGLGQYDPTNPTAPWPGLPYMIKLRNVHIIGTTNRSTAVPLPQNVGPDGCVIAPTIPSDATSYGRSVYDVSDNEKYIESEIFVNEALNSKNAPVKVIIEGGYKGGEVMSYYRIDICRPDPTTGKDTYLDILRNHLYRISITDITGPGYATLEEAISAPPLNNIVVDITALDEGGSGIVLFDGNSSITADVLTALIYGKPNGTTLYPIVTVKAIIGNGVKTAQVTGTGIATPIVLENNMPKLIEVAPPVGTTRGELTITVGRLKHTVPFKVQLPVDAHFDFLPFQNVASMTVEKPQPWITLSNSRTYVKSEQQLKYIIGDGDNKAVVHFDENISTTDAPRMASVLLQRVGMPFKERVVFEQLNLSGMVMGLFGGDKDNGGYTKQLAVESVEEFAEREYDDYFTNGKVDGFQWGFNDKITGITDFEYGRLSTITLAKTKFADNGVVTNETDLSIHNNYPARYCYDKNRDTNGNGKIDDAEVVWYLPAQNQLMGLWIAHARIITPFAAIDYWSATENQGNMSWYVNFDTFSYAGGGSWRHNKIDARKVRCVREL